MYLDFIEFVRVEVFAFLTFIFFTTLLFDKKSRGFSIVILVLSFLFFMTPDLDESLNDVDYNKAMLDAIYVVIAYCSAAMLALMFNKDKESKNHAFLFVCVIFLHIMLSLYVHNGEFWWNYYFVACYNEILILIAIRQMWVSKDGFIRIYHGVERYYSRLRRYISIYKPEVTRTQAESKGK